MIDVAKPRVSCAVPPSGCGLSFRCFSGRQAKKAVLGSGRAIRSRLYRKLGVERASNLFKEEAKPKQTFFELIYEGHMAALGYRGPAKLIPIFS